MVFDKYSIKGDKVGQVELSDTVFGAKVNDVLVYEYIKAANANLRQGTHKTKGRTEVSGGGAKPWRQKGTGRARQGTTRAPQWRSGGVVFGPTPRSYRIELPKKIKQAAMRSIFSLKAGEGSIKVVEDFSVESGKTKEMFNILVSLDSVKGLVIVDQDDMMLKRSINNIKTAAYNSAKRLSGRDLFYSRNIVLTESAAKFISEKYAKGE